MTYHGNNPVALALAQDSTGQVLDEILQNLSEYQAAAEQDMRSAAVPATYQRNMAAMECAALCAAVVKEFQAVNFA